MAVNVCGDTVVELDKNVGRVVNVISEGAGIVESAGKYRLCAENVFDKVDAMHAHIHQRSAARLRFILTPCPGDFGIPAGKLSSCRNDLSDSSVCDHFLYLLMIAVVAHHKSGCDKNAGFLCGGEDLFAVLDGESRGLFKQDVLACLCRLDRLLLMADNRRSDIYRFDFGIGNKLVGGGVAALCVILCAELFGKLCVDFHYGNELCVFRKHHSRKCSAVCDTAGADDAPFDLFHSVSSKKT